MELDRSQKYFKICYLMCFLQKLSKADSIIDKHFTGEERAQTGGRKCQNHTVRKPLGQDSATVL